MSGSNPLITDLNRTTNDIPGRLIRRILCIALGRGDVRIEKVRWIGGMTNTNYKVTAEGKEYVFRYSGRQTQKMISRNNERANLLIAGALGIDAPTIYFDVNTGIKITCHIAEAETLSPATAKEPGNMEQVASLLRQLHQSGKSFNNTFDVFEHIELYEHLAKAGGGEFYPHYQSVKAEVLKLRQRLNRLGGMLTPCHNDTVPENFIKSGNERLYLIDWEYSGMNDPLWDIAAHSLECGFSETDTARFLNMYGFSADDKNTREKLLIYKICQDFLWSVWTIVKESDGADFGPYGINRFKRAVEQLADLQIS